MTAVYLYCVIKSAKRPSTARAPRGLPGASAPAPVELGRSLWLIVADVPLETYGSEQLDAALSDLQWVAKIAVAHESVVEHFTRGAGATVVPMKLFTMFSSIDRAVHDIVARRREMDAIVKRIAGCEEWGVRVTRGAGTPGRRPAAAAPARSGAAFLAAKKRARDDAREAALAAATAAMEAYSALAAVSRDARRRDDVPDRATTPPLLDAAFLVPTRRRTPFKSAARRAAARCAQTGAQMTLSGPWPAYNFIQSPKERT